MSNLDFRTIWVSDVHLGTRDSKVQYLVDFLQNTHCEYLYLVGDIFDVERMRRGVYWPEIKNQLINLIREKAREGAKVVYIPGNHDEVFRAYDKTSLMGVYLCHEAVHKTVDGKRLLIQHGDRFDHLMQHNSWLVRIGDWLYDPLVYVNRLCNCIRRGLNLPYWSLANAVKARLKGAMNYIKAFEEVVVEDTLKRGFDGVVCGHIHHAVIAEIKGITYCNSGDWIESCSAVVEDHDGELRILHWAEESSALLSDMSDTVDVNT